MIWLRQRTADDCIRNEDIPRAKKCVEMIKYHARVLGGSMSGPYEVQGDAMRTAMLDELGTALDLYVEVAAMAGIEHEDDPYREMGRLVTAGLLDVAEALAQIINTCRNTGLQMGMAVTLLPVSHVWDRVIQEPARVVKPPGIRAVVGGERAA